MFAKKNVTLFTHQNELSIFAILLAILSCFICSFFCTIIFFLFVEDEDTAQGHSIQCNRSCEIDKNCKHNDVVINLNDFQSHFSYECMFSVKKQADGCSNDLMISMMVTVMVLMIFGWLV